MGDEFSVFSFQFQSPKMVACVAFSFVRLLTYFPRLFVAVVI